MTAHREAWGHSVGGAYQLGSAPLGPPYLHLQLVAPPGRAATRQSGPPAFEIGTYPRHAALLWSYDCLPSSPVSTARFSIVSSTPAMASKQDGEVLTLHSLETALAKDTKVKLAGLDVDGTRPFTQLCSPC